MDDAMLTQFRQNKDEFFGSSPHSPLDPDAQRVFSGLDYFDQDPGLVFTVDVAPADGAPITIGTSDGMEREYRRAGTVTIEIDTTPVTLALYETGHPGYFLPFRDATSGHETYGAGRYLDLTPGEDGRVTIDFNLAYNPYCAYTDGYSCALPPTENWLSVPITAGERTYRADTTKEIRTEMA